MQGEEYKGWENCQIKRLIISGPTKRSDAERRIKFKTVLQIV